MHIIYDQKQDRFWSGWFRILTAQPVNCAKWFLKVSARWQFCWMTGVKFNSIHSILVRFLHITQFTVCAAKNLTVFVADSPRCLEWSSMWLPYREPCVSCQSPASAGLGSPGDSRSHSGHVGNTRRPRLITCCLLWPAARRFWLGLHLIRLCVAHACGSRCTRGCKHQAPLWFTENIHLPMWILSIAISIIDLNVHRWSTTKLM